TQFLENTHIDSSLVMSCWGRAQRQNFGLHTVGYDQDDPGHEDQQQQAHDVGDHERRHPADDGAQRHVRHHVLDHEDVQAQRRGDQADLGGHHHDDAEPHQIEAQRGHDGVEDGHGQHDHGHGFQKAPQHQVDGADDQDHHDGRDVDAVDEAQQLVGQAGHRQEVGEHQRADHQGEHDGGGLGRLDQHGQVQARLPAAALEGHQEGGRRADAGRFRWGEHAAVDAAHDDHEQHGDGQHALGGLQALAPAGLLAGAAQVGVDGRDDHDGDQVHQHGDHAGQESRGEQLADVGFRQDAVD